MTIVEHKRELRKRVKEFKKHFLQTDNIEQSEAIFNKVEQLPAFIDAKTVLLYWSMDDEVGTHSFIEKWWKQKTILLPSVDGDTLNIKQFKGIKSMLPGESFGILEPTGANFNDLNLIDLIIVPGVAFDKANNRMGRGRGYYDKLLQVTEALKVGVCFNFQFVEKVPVEDHDLPMDLVIKA